MILRFFQKRLVSFRNAVLGLRDILSTEHNAWIHATLTIIVVGLSLWLEIDFLRFLLIILVTCLVWIAEAFNTVLEIVIDIVSPEYSEAAKRAKNIAASAVLFAAFGAFITGLVLLLPPLLLKLKL
jgi:diacylglycerol kinase (ATP)